MKNKLPLFTTVLATFVLGSANLLTAPAIDDLTEGSPYYYQDPPGTSVSSGVGGLQGDTDSGINHLPVYRGHFQTNDTFRFINIAEQVFSMVGDGKHGLWRYQDNGYVRLYLTVVAEGAGGGIPAPTEAITDPLYLHDLLNMDAFVDTFGPAEMASLAADYKAFEYSPAENFAMYPTFTAGSFGTGSGVTSDGRTRILGLPISHPFFCRGV